MQAQDKFHLVWDKFEESFKQRNITVQSDELYCGSAGLYNIGQLGCARKQNFLALLGKLFTAYENHFELYAPIMTPKTVLDASGNIKKFCDCIVKDGKTNTPYLAVNLLDAFFAKKTTETSDAAEAERLREAHLSINNMTQWTFRRCSRRSVSRRP